MRDIKEILKEFLYVPVRLNDITPSDSAFYKKLRNGERLSQDDFDTIYAWEFCISDEYNLFAENDIDDYSHYFDHSDDDYYHLTADGLDGARKLGIKFKEYDAKKFQYFVIKKDDNFKDIRKRFPDLDFIFAWLKDDDFILITQNEVDGKKVEKFFKSNPEVEFSKF